MGTQSVKPLLLCTIYFVVPQSKHVTNPLLYKRCTATCASAGVMAATSKGHNCKSMPLAKKGPIVKAVEEKEAASSII